MREVYVLGTGMTTFGRHPLGAAGALVRESTLAALRDGACTYADADAVYMASCHPASPRGIYLAKELGVTGVRIEHIENASATGLTAIHEAATAIRAGEADVVLVIGFDAPDRPLPVEDIVAQEGHLPAVVLFAMWACRRMHEHGTRDEHLAAVAAKNWNYARSNPLAARRAAEVVTIDQILASRIVAPPLRSMMCTAWGEGAAAIVLGSREAARKRAVSGRPTVRLAGSAIQSETYQPGHVLTGAIVGPAEMTRSAAAAAMAQAGVGPGDLDVVQLHDAFAIEELVYYELLGLCKEGDAETLVDRGAFGPGSRAQFGLPEVSTDGGLIARGHPGGPTGVAQVHETVRRLRGEDRIGLCHLIGAGSLCAVQVYAREERMPITA